MQPKFGIPAVFDATLRYMGIRHKKHLTTPAALVGQCTPAPGYDHKCQVTPASVFPAWFSPLNGAGFTVLWRARHRSMPASTSTLSTSEQYTTTPYAPRNSTIKPHKRAMLGVRTHTLVGPSVACRPSSFTPRVYMQRPH